MKKNQRPEIAYLVQNILPLFASQFNFPLPEDEKNTKIEEIPIRIASSVKKPDVVYYHNGIPIFLIEAKKTGKPEKVAVEQALSYIRNYPVEEFSKNNIKPRFFAVTIGKQINFYAHRFEIEQNNFKDWAEKLDSPIFFDELLKKYGLKKIEKKEVFTPEIFRKEVLNELGPLYNLKEKISPDVVKNVALQVLTFLKYGRDYTGHRPYVDLEKFRDRQAQIRQVYEKFDWINSLGPEIAKEFRVYVLRSFQGTNLNQYLTEQCVIAFMINLVGKLIPDTKVLDFECGSGGFLVAAIDKGIQLENISGIDIDELPYIVAKTYLALYFKKTGVENVETLPIKKDNGLFYHGDDFDLVIGNPAGGNKYEHGEEQKILNEGLINLKDKKHVFSEYELSIQQAVRSAKIKGKICLILPDGFFSNSNNEFLRKYVVSNSKILAIISLPRGVFKKGTSTKQQQKGSQISTQKMSILFLEKTKDVDEMDPIGKVDSVTLNYPVYLALLNEPEFKSGAIEDWLEPELNIVLNQWQEWQQYQKLKVISSIKIIKKNKDRSRIKNLDLFNEQKFDLNKKPKLAKEKSKTKISKSLDDLFK